MLQGNDVPDHHCGRVGCLSQAKLWPLCVGAFRADLSHVLQSREGSCGLESSMGCLNSTFFVFLPHPMGRGQVAGIPRVPGRLIS